MVGGVRGFTAGGYWDVSASFGAVPLAAQVALGKT